MEDISHFFHCKSPRTLCSKGKKERREREERERGQDKRKKMFRFQPLNRFQLLLFLSGDSCLLFQQFGNKNVRLHGIFKYSTSFKLKNNNF